MAVSFEYHCYAISAFTMSVFFCTLSSSQVDLSKSQSTHARKSQNSLLKAAVKIHLLALYTSQKEEGSIVRCGLSISLSNVYFQEEQKTYSITGFSFSKEWVQSTAHRLSLQSIHGGVIFWIQPKKVGRVFITVYGRHLEIVSKNPLSGSLTIF